MAYHAGELVMAGLYRRRLWNAGPHPTEAEMDDLCRVAESIRRALAANPVPFEHATSRSFPITVSIGAAMYEPVSEVKRATGIETPDQLVSAAMFALATGRSTRNRVVVFRRELRVES